MMFEFLNREKINYGLPVFTFDVNSVALREPTKLTLNASGIYELEWNYFEHNNIELCVTPETQWEITKGHTIAEQGWIEYQRFQKSNLFKRRPNGTILELDEQNSNELWLGIREALFSSVSDSELTIQQRSDISQMFFHTTASGSLDHSAFITLDRNFHDHAPALLSNFGVQVMDPRTAWLTYQSSYKLDIPSRGDIEVMRTNQLSYVTKLWYEAKSDK